jgi:hypothetical protein
MGVSGNVSGGVSGDTSKMGVSGGVTAGVSADTGKVGVSGGVSGDTNVSKMGVKGNVSGGVTTDTSKMGVSANAGVSADANAPVTLQLTGVGTHTDVSGEVTITPKTSSSVVVKLSLTGAKKATHAAHIHEGTCDSPGKIVHTLKAVTGTKQTSTTTVSGHSLPELADGNHIVAVHTGSSSKTATLACAAINSSGSGMMTPSDSTSRNAGQGYQSGNQQNPSDTSSMMKRDTSSMMKSDTSSMMKHDTTMMMKHDSTTMKADSSSPR